MAINAAKKTSSLVLPNTQTTQSTQHEKKLRDVSELYQRQFMQEMVKAMRGTVQESGLIKVGQAEKIYREQLDQNYVENWSKKGGIGLADLIYKQLSEKLGPQLGLNQPPPRPQGPLALDESAQFNGMVKASQKGSKTMIEYQRHPQVGPHQPEVLAIKAPWSGKFLGMKQIQSDEYLFEMQHDFPQQTSVKSQFVFKGHTLPELKTDQFGFIEQGTTIGLLSPEARRFYWNLEPQFQTLE